jgi:hypothetical protein
MWSVLRKVLLSVMISTALEKVLSDGALVAGITKMSLANLESIGIICSCPFQYSRMSQPVKNFFFGLSAFVR